MARKMKDSGIEWIGEIPEGWSVSKVLHCLSMPITDGPHTTPILYDTGIPFVSAEAVSCGNGRIDFSHIRGYISEKFYKECCQKYIPEIDDIYMIKSGATTGRVAIVDTTKVFTIWSPLAVFRCNKNCMLPKFLFYYLQSPAFQKEVEFGWTFGTQQNVGMRSLEQMKICVPPLNEQNTIVNHLDYQCAQIDLLLQKARSSIEEYKKLKQAVITQAVTKGVRGEREMKDSGVEWIGEIPKEWRKTQLRHCATIKSGITLGKSYSKDTVLIERPYLRVANVQGGYVDLNDLATIEVTPDEDLKYRLHSGDVLMTEGGDRDKLGRGCVWHGEIEPCLHQNHVFAVQTNETVLLPEFLEYLTASDVGRSYFDITAIKTTNLACTSSSKVLAFTIPLPPIEEQIEIVSYIKKRSLELNKLIMKKELLVQELESYKKSLIYEVVTGKREV